mgnify:CR=1 FL=1
MIQQERTKPHQLSNGEKQETITLISETKFTYNTNIENYNYGKLTINYILACAYLEDYSVFTIQLNTDRFDKIIMKQQNVIEINELDFDLLTEDLTGL